jgi:hypothetical protein
MLIPPGYASVSVDEICQPQFEDLELNIPGGDGKGHSRIQFTVSYFDPNVTL